MVNGIEKQAILEAYNVCNGFARQASRKYVFVDEDLPKQKYHLCHQTYLTYWRKQGFKIRRVGSVFIDGRLDEKVIFLPKLQQYDFANFQRKARGQHLSSSEKQAIIHSYQFANGVAREAERHLPYSVMTILSVWRKAGLIRK